MVDIIVFGKFTMDFGPPMFTLFLIELINIDPHPGCEIIQSLSHKFQPSITPEPLKILPIWGEMHRACP